MLGFWRDENETLHYPDVLTSATGGNCGNKPAIFFVCLLHTSHRQQHKHLVLRRIQGNVTSSQMRQTAPLP